MSDELGVKKFQWSKFSPDRSEQIVIRTDDKEEFMGLIDEAKGILPTTAAFPNDEGNRAHAPEQTQPAGPVCSVNASHGPMQWKSGVSKTSGKPYAFWGCAYRDATGYCKGKQWGK